MANMKQHEIDLLRSYRSKKFREVHKQKKIAMKASMAMVSIVMAALLTGAYMWQRTRLDDINTQVEDYDLLLSDPVLIQNNATMKLLDKQYDSLGKLYDTFTGHTLMIALMENRFTYLKSDFFDNIYKCCSTDIEMVKYEVSGYYFTGGFVTLSSVNVSDFVARLRETGMFSEITYEGFDYEQQTKDGPIEYSFTVNCRFKTGGEE